MLAKQQRLTVADFKCLSRASKHLHQPLVQVQFVPSSEKKAAVVVSKKVAKKAVVRNRIRRMIFAVIESQWDLLPIGLYVVKVKPQARQATLQTIRAEVIDVFGSLTKTR